MKEGRYEVGDEVFYEKESINATVLEIRGIPCGGCTTAGEAILYFPHTHHLSCQIRQHNAFQFLKLKLKDGRIVDGITEDSVCISS